MIFEVHIWRPMWRPIWGEMKLDPKLFNLTSSDPEFGSGMHRKIWPLLNHCGRFDHHPYYPPSIVITITIIILISLLRDQSSWWRSNILRTIVRHWPHGLPTSDQVRELEFFYQFTFFFSGQKTRHLNNADQSLTYISVI